MAQIGFFNLSDRYASVDVKKDLLVENDTVAPWKEFRPVLGRENGGAKLCPGSCGIVSLISLIADQSRTQLEHFVRILCGLPQQVRAKFCARLHRVAGKYLSPLLYFQRNTIRIDGTPFPNEGHLSVRIP